MGHLKKQKDETGIWVFVRSQSIKAVFKPYGSIHTYIDVDEVNASVDI